MSSILHGFLQNDPSIPQPKGRILIPLPWIQPEAEVMPVDFWG